MSINYRAEGVSGKFQVTNRDGHIWMSTISSYFKVGDFSAIAWNKPRRLKFINERILNI